jgi:hypothetical protein
MLKLHARITSAVRGDKRKCNSKDLCSFLSLFVVWNCAQRHIVFHIGIETLRSDCVGLVENVSPLNTDKLVLVTCFLAMTGSNLANESLLYFFLGFPPFVHVSA